MIGGDPCHYASFDVSGLQGGPELQIPASPSLLTRQPHNSPSRSASDVPVKSGDCRRLFSDCSSPSIEPRTDNHMHQSLSDPCVAVLSGSMKRSFSVAPSSRTSQNKTETNKRTAIPPLKYPQTPLPEIQRLLTDSTTTTMDSSRKSIVETLLSMAAAPTVLEPFNDYGAANTCSAQSGPNYDVLVEVRQEATLHSIHLFPVLH